MLNIAALHVLLLVILSSHLSAQPPLAVPFRFDWPIGSTIDVIIEDEQIIDVWGVNDSTFRVSSYRFTILPHEDGRRILLDSFTSNKSGNRAGERQGPYRPGVIDKDFVVSDAGEIIGMDDGIDAYRRVDKDGDPFDLSIDPLVAVLVDLGDRDAPGLDSLRVGNNTAMDWGMIVALLNGRSILPGREVRESYHHIYDGPVDRVFKTISTLHGVWAPCSDGDDSICMTVTARTMLDSAYIEESVAQMEAEVEEGDPEGGRLALQMLRRSRLTSQMTLTTNPATLIPVRLEYTRWTAILEPDFDTMTLREGSVWTRRTYSFRFTPPVE